MENTSSSTSKTQTSNITLSQIKQELDSWRISLDGDWSDDEIRRIWQVFHRLADQADALTIPQIFNDQATKFFHSGMPGRAGRTKGDEVYLDDDWTDWTLAHELGHRWNNAWEKQPEQWLRKSLGAGRWEWLKRKLRSFEKWLRKTAQKLDLNWKIDWQALWYHPGKAPPPCGVDRNFNASEDLAESFAATIFPEDAKQRASNAARRLTKFTDQWDWGRNYQNFWLTPRGQLTSRFIKERSPGEGHADQTDRRAAKD